MQVAIFKMKCYQRVGEKIAKNEVNNLLFCLKTDANLMFHIFSSFSDQSGFTYQEISRKNFIYLSTSNLRGKQRKKVKLEAMEF